MRAAYGDTPLTVNGVLRNESGGSAAPAISVRTRMPERHRQVSARARGV